MIKRLLCYSYNKSQILYFKILYLDRKSTRLNSSHGYISYAVFCLKKKKQEPEAIEDGLTQELAADIGSAQPTLMPPAEVVAFRFALKFSPDAISIHYSAYAALTYH